MNAASLLPEAVAEESRLTVRFAMLSEPNRDGAFIELEHGTNLSGWTKVAVPESSGTFGDVDFIITPEGDLNHVESRLSLVASDPDPRIFVRLEAGHP